MFSHCHILLNTMFNYIICRPVPAVRHSHDDRDARGPISSSSRTGSGVASSRSAPRLNLGAATKQILSGIGHGTARSGREGRRREKGDSPSSAEKVTGNHHQPEQNRVPNSGDCEHAHQMHILSHILLMYARSVVYVLNIICIWDFIKI